MSSYLKAAEKKHDLSITMIPDEDRVELLKQIDLYKKCLLISLIIDQQLKFEIITYNKEETLGQSDCHVLYWKNKHFSIAT